MVLDVRPLYPYANASISWTLSFNKSIFRRWLTFLEPVGFASIPPMKVSAKCWTNEITLCSLYFLFCFAINTTWLLSQETRKWWWRYNPRRAPYFLRYHLNWKGHKSIKGINTDLIYVDYVYNDNAVVQLSCAWSNEDESCARVGSEFCSTSTNGYELYDSWMRVLFNSFACS